MPVEIKWYIQDHVLIARYYGHVSAEDIHKQYLEGIRMSESVDTALVHMIADIADVTSFPKNVMEFQGSFGEKAKNAGWVVLVGENKMIRFLSSIISNLMKLRFAYVNTHDEAVEFITARDPFLSLEEALDQTLPYSDIDDDIEN